MTWIEIYNSDILFEKCTRRAREIQASFYYLRTPTWRQGFL